MIPGRVNGQPFDPRAGRQGQAEALTRTLPPFRLHGRACSDIRSSTRVASRPLCVPSFLPSSPIALKPVRTRLPVPFDPSVGRGMCP